MIRKKIIIVFLVCFISVAFAAPKIDIAGLDGGQRWTWVEAEYFDPGQTTWGIAKWSSDTGLSNYNYYSHPDTWHGSPYETTGTGYANYDVYLPAAMDSSAKVYIKQGAGDSGDYTGYVDIDGVQVAEYTLQNYGNAYGANPHVWAESTAIGPISAGIHQVNLGRGTDVWTYMDGFYIVEGDITAGDVASIYTPFDGGSNRRFIGAPIPVDSHEIFAASVTPTITVAGAASYDCYLNGVAYTPGTAISLSGVYALEVYAWDTANNTYSHSGVNFVLNPSPPPPPMTLDSCSYVYMDFSGDEGWLGYDANELINSGWQLSRSAKKVSGSDIGCYVAPDFADGVLVLRDFVSDGYPISYYDFGPGILSADLQMHAGTSLAPGGSNPQGRIMLCDGRVMLASLELRYSNGEFSHGDGTSYIVSMTPKKTDHQIEMSWSVDPDGQNGKISAVFRDSAGSLVYVLADDNSFLADGVPDNILLQCGWNSNTTAILYVDDMAIAPNETQPGIFAPIAGDISGQNDTSDSRVSFFDIEAMAANWLDSSAFVNRPLPSSVANFFSPSSTPPDLDPNGIYPRGKKLALGFFYADVHENPGSWVRQDGFTTRGPYYSAVMTAAGDQELPYIQKIGMPLDWYAPDFVMPSDSEIQTEIASQVNTLITPKIAWWYLLPEEIASWNTNGVHYLEIAADTIRATDPCSRPVWMYIPGHHPPVRLAVIVEHLDICGKGMYANRSGYQEQRIYIRASIEREIEGIALSGNSTAIPIATLEFQDDPGEELRPLIPDWVRHDAYSSLMAGAKGIDIYMGYRDGFNTAAYEFYSEAWKQVAGELNGSLGLANVFLYGDKKSDIDVNITSGPSTVDISLLNNSGVYETFVYPSVGFFDVAYGQSRYLFLCNSANSAVTVSVTGLPVFEIRAENAFVPGNPFVIDTGGIDVHLDALEVKAFRFTAPPEDCEDAAVMFLKGDISLDCIVNLADFTVLAENWMICVEPNGCQ